MTESSKDVVSATKRYVCDSRHRLRLFDAVGQEVREVVIRLRHEQLSVTARWSEDEFRRRVPAFEEIVADLCRVEALLVRWGGEREMDTLTLPIRHALDCLDHGSGNTGWLELQWYPILTLFYSAGVAAVSAGRYGALRALMHLAARVSGRDQLFVTAIAQGINDRTGAFRLLPELDRHKTPCSDRLFAVLQPLLDEVLFLGSDFQRAFDRFEMLYAIECAYQTNRGWGPLGQFVWKGGTDGPLSCLIKELQDADDSWPPVAAGLCGGSIEKMKSTTSVFAENLARSSTW